MTSLAYEQFVAFGTDNGEFLFSICRWHGGIGGENGMPE
jgi:hypothetical protein